MKKSLRQQIARQKTKDIAVRLLVPVCAYHSAEQINQERREAAAEIQKLRDEIKLYPTIAQLPLNSRRLLFEMSNELTKLRIAAGSKP